MYSNALHDVYSTLHSLRKEILIGATRYLLLVESYAIYSLTLSKASAVRLQREV
jgi:hypothetical protein